MKEQAKNCKGIFWIAMFGDGPDMVDDFSVVTLEHNFRNSPGVLTFIHTLESFLRDDMEDKNRWTF
jgi:hypothetical protein